MSETFAALELDRVLRLVASFASSERGRTAVMTTLPRFARGEGSLLFRFTRELGRFVAEAGNLAFPGLDNAALLERPPAGGLEATDLAALINLVRGIVEVRTALSTVVLAEELARRCAALPLLDAFLAHCERQIGPGGEILDSASPVLARARAARERHRQAIVAALNEVRRGHAHLKDPYTVRRDRYCLPVPSAERHTVGGLVLDASSSGATAYVEPFAVVELNNALAEATALVAEEERRIVAELGIEMSRRREALLAAAETLAELDAGQARVSFGRASGASLLEPGAGRTLTIVAGRHPLLDPALAPLRTDVLGEPGSTREIVPLHLSFPEDARVLLLSGPNAGGKTVALKTLGLAVLMAYAGVPVLAEAESTIPPLLRVWCHIGDEQSLLSDLSTFSGAMRATAELLASATPDTLVLYDELGSGTDPEEGAALAAALLERLSRLGCWAVATAHLVTVAAHVEALPGARNAAMGYDEANGRPTYRFEVGLPGRSRGLEIAAACGVGDELVGRARELLSAAFLALDTHLARLHEQTERLRRHEAELVALQGAAEQSRQVLETERARVVAERGKLREELERERDALRRRAREALAQALAELQAARERGDIPGKRRLAAIRHGALALADDEPPAPPPGTLASGERVRLRGGRAEGIVGHVVGDRVEILLAGKRLWVEASACEPLGAPAAAPRTPVEVTAGGGEPAVELKLIGLDGEAARDELERFLDRSLLDGARHIRIVHGHGSGTLRRLVHEVLRDHPAVVSFAHPPQFRGGTGVTEAELEP